MQYTICPWVHVASTACRIFSISPVSLPALGCHGLSCGSAASSYLSRVCCAWIFILAIADMVFKWSSSLESTRPPDESSRFILVGARRVFANSKNTCYLHGRWPCFSRLIHSGHLVPGGLMVVAISEAFAVYWSHSPSGSFSGSPLDSF